MDRLLLLLAPYPPEDMTAYPVSPIVNNPANDSPACQLRRVGSARRVGPSPTYGWS